MKVLVIGGTHGNEWTGIIAVRKYAESFKQKFPRVQMEFIHANPDAYTINRRFKDEDLNRAFQNLQDPRPHSYEYVRALELKKIIQAEPCFVIDLHTTTSNMGATVIISHYNSVNFGVASKLSNELSDCRVIGSPDPKRKYLVSQSDFGLMIEVGPVANGTIEPKALEKTLAVLEIVLKTIEENHFSRNGELEIYEEIQDFSYPTDSSGELSAYIHPDFQGKDFVPVNGAYSPFKSFNGEELNFQTSENLYPIFINEAAYYPSKHAFTLCRKKRLRF